MRCLLKSPGHDEGDRKSYGDGGDDEANDPVWDFEKWKNLGGNLNQQPADDRVRDRDLVDIAPLQFGKGCPSSQQRVRIRRSLMPRLTLA